MFADDKSIENFQQLFFEFKKYLELQKEYTKLELTEKLTILLSTLINCHCHYFPQETHHLPDGKLPCRSVS